MKIFFLILTLTFCQITSAAETCDSALKGSQQACTYLTGKIKDLPLANALCGCAAGVIEQKGEYCNRKGNFAAVPACGTFINSEPSAYDALIESKFSHKLIEVILRVFVGVCTNSDEEIQKSFNNVFTNPAWYGVIEMVIQLVYPEQGVAFNKCYGQIRGLVSPPK